MGRKVCVLIDDDAGDREVFANAIAAISAEFHVILIENATECIKMIRDREIVPDVIFLDLNMPGVNGYQFLVYLKGQIRYRSVPVIVYSTTSDPEEAKRTRKLGAATFFEKPIRYSDLCLSLSMLLSDERIFQKTAR
jgi:DNA-binding NtrC family response regulator